MNLAKYFDHTNLNPLASREDIKRLCDEAKTYGFFSVCVHPYYISWAKENLSGSDVKIATVVGFPQGQNTAETKIFEAQDVLLRGADEIDMVINFAALKDRHDAEVFEEVHRVKKVCGEKILKVIFETSQLTDDEIVRACTLSDAAGADFVKTSTGFLGHGATPEHVALMKAHCRAEVKASGGIRCLADAQRMIEAGASRLGSSSGVKIMQELEDETL